MHKSKPHHSKGEEMTFTGLEILNVTTRLIEQHNLPGSLVTAML